MVNSGNEALREIRLSAVMAARLLSESKVREAGCERVQTLLAFLEKASDDLRAAQSAQPASHEETLFPSKAMAFEAIEKLADDGAVGFVISRDGMGRCRVRLWQVPRE